MKLLKSIPWNIVVNMDNVMRFFGAYLCIPPKLKKMVFSFSKTVDVESSIGYNEYDVRIRIILFMFNIRFVVSFLLFYTY